MSPQPVTPVQWTALPQSAYRDPRVRLLDLQRNLLTHHPDSETGWVAYRAQVDAWHRKHSQYLQASPDEFKPYPLTPGTQPISSGACFNCRGKHGVAKHMQFDCPVKRSFIKPEFVYQSLPTVHSCPSPVTSGKFVNCQLIPSTALLSFPGRYQTSTIWC